LAALTVLASLASPASVAAQGAGRGERSATAAGKGAAAQAAPTGPTRAELAPVPTRLGPTPPTEFSVFDVPNDDGTNLGVLFHWLYATTPETTATIEVQVNSDILVTYRLTAAEQKTVDAALADLATDLAPWVPRRDKLLKEKDETYAAFMEAKAKQAADALALCQAYYGKVKELDDVNRQIDRANDRYLSRTRCHCRDHQIHDLRIKARYYEYLEATLRHNGGWLASDIDGVSTGEIRTKGDHPEYFGLDPEEADKLFLQVDSLTAMNPDIFAGTFHPGTKDNTDTAIPPAVSVNLQKNHFYELRMVTAEGDVNGTPVDLGGARATVNFFNVSLLNNFVFAVAFCIVILAAIMLARRNPNLFIRRIQGLEAVDEAIGRATEMGKPVLYLCGLDPLSSLNTLAAINVLGRVARRIAHYDSDLVVPCRDPVVMTVAQEVVKEAYIDQGRPDAYREDNIFFLTDDQFAFTAATCGIMMRDKPAANFFMGGYYAEALLLAETGTSTHAIQIAGTDSLNQLPFFITACDYTLIGEELYAASAYLSREPLLLGSLKGQDLGKALIMVLIVVQTLLFVIQAILAKTGTEIPLDFLKKLVQPL
jgi:hypothetical protein